MNGIFPFSILLYSQKKSRKWYRISIFKTNTYYSIPFFTAILTFFFSFFYKLFLQEEFPVRNITARAPGKKKKEILLHIYLMNVSFSFFIIHYFMGWIDLFRCCKSDALIYFTTIKKINDALKMREEMTEILFRNSGKCGIWRNYLNHKW